LWIPLRCEYLFFSPFFFFFFFIDSFLFFLVTHKKKYQNCQKGFVELELTALDNIAFPNPPTRALTCNTPSTSLPTVKNPSFKVMIYQAIGLKSGSKSYGSHSAHVTLHTYQFGCQPGERPERMVCQSTGKVANCIHPYFGSSFTFSLRTNADSVYISIKGGPSRSFSISDLRDCCTAGENQMWLTNKKGSTFLNSFFLFSFLPFSFFFFFFRCKIGNRIQSDEQHEL